MGSLKDGEPIGPRTRVRRAAMLLLSESAESTFACLSAARAGEVESGIHDMRVAAKRLRERMVLFQPVYRRREYQGALDRIDALNDVLGVVRDSDVLSDHLGRLAGGPVVDLLGNALSVERVEQQQRLTSFLDELVTDGFAGALTALFAEGRHSAKHAVAQRTCRRFARIEIGVRLSKAQRRVSQITGEDDAAGLHRLRVANKHLRYTIEPFLPVFGKPLQQAHKRVAELHSKLGDLHDWDVLLARLAKSARKRGLEEQVAPDIAAATAQRTLCYAEVAKLMGEGGQPECFDQIAIIIG